MRWRPITTCGPNLGAYALPFGDFSFLLLAFFLVAGKLTPLGGHLHAALPKDMSG